MFKPNTNFPLQYAKKTSKVPRSTTSFNSMALTADHISAFPSRSEELKIEKCGCQNWHQLFSAICECNHLKTLKIQECCFRDNDLTAL